MTVYVDDIVDYHKTVPACPNARRWCHMATDGPIEELHAMAERIGLKREWFQDPNRFPHYDLVVSRRALAVKAGAVEVSGRELLRLCWLERRG